MNFFFLCRKRGFSSTSPLQVADEKVPPHTRGTAPKSNVGLLLNTTASAHLDETALSTQQMDGLADLYDGINEEELTRKTQKNAEHSWFTSPIHRPSDEAVPFSELVQTKPLTASVLKAKTEGNLKQDYLEDLSQTPLEEFDMDVFEKTDKTIYKARLENAIGFMSPYHMELAKLRREKLKLEETYLLKLRCQAELEETRGPKPKWYELKTKHFNRELRKNNDIVDNSQSWRTLNEYQNEITAASGRWEDLQQ